MKGSDGFSAQAVVEVLAEIKDLQCHLHFCAGHAGVQSNERADRLAGLATIIDSQPMDCTDIVNVF